MSPDNKKILELLDLRHDLILSGENNFHKLNRMIHRLEHKLFLEDTSATGGPAGAATGGGDVSAGGVAFSSGVVQGMGNVHAPQPSTFAGSTLGPDYTNGGGRDGSGDVAFPFPAIGGKKMYQKEPARNFMGKNHGARTGKKSREKSQNLNKLKALFNKDLKKELLGRTKVMDFDSFSKEKMSIPTKIN